MQLSQTRTPWDRGRFATLVKSVVEHFGVAQAVLDHLYTIVAHATFSEESVATWETLKERYNQLRNE
jgi:hypothetical protein